MVKPLRIEVVAFFDLSLRRVTNKLATCNFGDWHSDLEPSIERFGASTRSSAAMKAPFVSSVSVPRSSIADRDRDRTRKSRVLFMETSAGRYDPIYTDRKSIVAEFVSILHSWL
jgi:hypothetical protein